MIKNIIKIYYMYIIKLSIKLKTTCTYYCKFRTATVSAEEDVEVLTLTRSWLHKLMDSEIMNKKCVKRIRETVKQREMKDQTHCWIIQVIDEKYICLKKFGKENWSKNSLLSTLVSAMNNSTVV